MRRWTVRAGLLSATLLLGACAALRPGGPAATDDGPLLWRLEQGGAVSYLFGTVHVRVRLEEALGPTGARHLSSADTVVVELDLDSPTTSRRLTKLIKTRGRLPADVALPGLLTPAAWEAVQTRLGDRFPAAGLARLEPWLVVLLALGDAATPESPGGADRTAPPAQRFVPMDLEIVRRARADGKRVQALETPSEQVDAMSALGRAQSVAILEEVASDPDALGKSVDTLIGATRGPGATTRLEDYVAQLAGDTPAVADVMIFRRNERWIPRLAPLLATGNVFVAVGAAHLVGERGLLALLEESGWEATRVTSPQTVVFTISSDTLQRRSAPAESSAHSQ